MTERGARPQVHDPAIKTLPAALAQKFTLHPGPVAALTDAAVLLVATEWPLYQSIEADSLVSAMATSVVIDPNRFLFHRLGRDPRIRYFTVGKAIR